VNNLTEILTPIVMKIDLKANEVIIKAGDGKHINGKGPVDGKLIVTNQRVYFISLAKNNAEQNLEIMPSEIKELIFYNTKIIFPNGLDVITKEGKNFRFTLKKRNDFGQLINKMY
jgi:GRAM domain